MSRKGKQPSAKLEEEEEDSGEEIDEEIIISTSNISL